jgi:hypothetical protein
MRFNHSRFKDQRAPLPKEKRPGMAMPLRDARPFTHQNKKPQKQKKKRSAPIAAQGERKQFRGAHAPSRVAVGALADHVFE